MSPSMKKIVFVGLTAVVTAGAAAFARRAMNYVWRRFAHEEPPEQPKWARFLVGAPLSKGVQKTVAPPA